MRYKLNKVNISVIVRHIIKRSNYDYYECQLASQPSVKIVCRSVKKKAFDTIEVGKKYDLTGFLIDCLYTLIDGTTYTTVIHFDKFVENATTSQHKNEVELVCYFKNKTQVYSSDKYKVCNVITEPVSDNVSGKYVEVSVWNKAIKSLDNLSEGGKFHIKAFVRGFHQYDGTSNIKLSPFKLTIF